MEISKHFGYPSLSKYIPKFALLWPVLICFRKASLTIGFVYDYCHRHIINIRFFVIRLDAGVKMTSNLFMHFYGTFLFRVPSPHVSWYPSDTSYQKMNFSIYLCFMSISLIFSYNYFFIILYYTLPLNILQRATV